MVTIDAHIPGYFFPNAAPEMKAFFWKCLIRKNSNVHDALMDYLRDAIVSTTEREMVDIIAEEFEKDWHTYQAADRVFAVLNRTTD